MAISVMSGSADPRRTKRIISLYKKGKSLRLIGDVFGVSHARVHQILVSQVPDLIRSRGAPKKRGRH